MPTAAELRARWPEAFPASWDVGNVILDLAIGEAQRRIADVTSLGARYPDAWLYLSAHLAALNRAMGTAGSVAAPGGGTISGPITSMAVGSVSVSFGASGVAVEGGDVPGESDLEATVFGRLYLGLIRNVTYLRLPWDG